MSAFPRAGKRGNMNSNLTEMLERLNIAETQPERVADNEFAKLRQDQPTVFLFRVR